MTQSKIKGLGGRIALLAVLSALMAAAGASAASAEVVVTPDAGLPWGGSTVTVSGTTAPAGTTEVGIVACNAEAETGERCDDQSATTTLRPVATYLTGGIAITVRRSWTDFDFRKGIPATELPSSTICFSAEEAEAEEEAGDQCEVVVSFYEATGKGPKPVGAPQAAPISFE